MATARWNIRPDGSNWGDFGDDDQTGRMALVTPERRLAALREATVGIAFTLSLPLDYPGGAGLTPTRRPPELRAGLRADGSANYNFCLSCLNPGHNDLVSDDMVTLYTQYSTQWDALCHYGQEFDVDGDGWLSKVYYNGFRAGTDVPDPALGDPDARKLGIEKLAMAGVQGRGVLVDLHRVHGDRRVAVGYDELMGIMAAQGAEVGPGDFLCLYTGFADLILRMAKTPDPAVLRNACPGLDGHDERLLRWITDSGVAAICADNYAVELIEDRPRQGRYPLLPLHEHCLFKQGIHLGELWHLADLAAWLATHGRTRFLLTAPPLRLTGAAGSPVTPIATV